MTTEVMFRKWKNDGDIMALFPYEIDNYNGDVMNYMHMGQHGSANYYYCRDATVPATEYEYQELMEELKEVGYSLKIVKRRNYIRLTAIKRLTEDK